jgi:5-methylcytosine-specific restriction endonuclease McrA
MIGIRQCWHTERTPNLNDFCGVIMARPYIPYDGPIVTRAEALSGGLKRYHTAEICGRGHTSQRYTKSKKCVACSNFFVDQYQDKNPDFIKATRRRCYEANVEHERSVARQWNTVNRERFYANEADRRLREPEACTALARRRYAREKNAEGSHSGAEIKALFKLQQGKCSYCGASLKKGYHADHVMPLSLGGSNWIKNITLACQRCNNRKYNKHPIVWAQLNGRLL